MEEQQCRGRNLRPRERWKASSSANEKKNKKKLVK